MVHATEKFDRREMEMVHTMLRREFALLPMLIRQAGDIERARIIANHFAFIADTLDHHHRAEDDDCWPILADRTGESAEEALQLMNDQHSELAIGLARVRDAILKWSNGDATKGRSQLGDDLVQLNELLNTHLCTEEALVVPLMVQHITASEWDQIVQKGAADADPTTLPLAFGMLMYEGDPELVDRALSAMPAESRPVIRKLAADAYAAHARAVHGTESPLRSTEL